MSDFHTHYRNQLERAAEVLFAQQSPCGNLALAQPPTVTSRSSWRPSRRFTVSAAIAAVAALLVLAGLALTGGEDQPAYAVAVRSDGSVALTLSEIVGVGPANARMIQLGVPVRLARAEEGCTAQGHRVALSGSPDPAEQRALSSARRGTPRRREELLVAMRLSSERALARLLQMARVERGGGKPGAVRMIIHPAAVPAGDTLVLAFRDTGRGVGGSIGLYRDPPPRCVRLR
jgi:hypothetical protein